MADLNTAPIVAVLEQILAELRTLNASVGHIAQEPAPAAAARMTQQK
jgi:hypothetical protein